MNKDLPKYAALAAAGLTGLYLFRGRAAADGGIIDGVVDGAGNLLDYLTGWFTLPFDIYPNNYGSKGDIHFDGARFSAQVEQWRPLVHEVAYNRAPDVHDNIILAVINKESGGNPSALGTAGERGLMQLKLAAVQDLGWSDVPWDSRTNIEAGTRYLQLQRERCEGVQWPDEKPVIFHALRSYNHGFYAAAKDPKRGADYANAVLRSAGG